MSIEIKTVGTGNERMHYLFVDGAIHNVYGTMAAARLAAISVIATW